MSKVVSEDQGAKKLADTGVSAKASGGDISQVAELLKVAKLVNDTSKMGDFAPLAQYVKEEAKYMNLAAKLLSNQNQAHNPQVALVKERLGYGLEAVMELAKILKAEADREEFKSILSGIGMNDLERRRLFQRSRGAFVNP